MKFVAAARLRRAQEAALAARPYAQELARVLRSTWRAFKSPNIRCWNGAKRERTGDCADRGRGLAGAFNANIFAQRRMSSFARIGEKDCNRSGRQEGRDALKKAGFQFAGSGECDCPRGVQDREGNRQS